MISSSSDSYSQLVAGNYDVLVGSNDSPNSSISTLAFKSVLTDFLDRFSQLECELSQPEGGYSNEFKLLKEFSRVLKEDKTNLQEGELEYNLRKNRYKDILPFSHTRVVLNSDPQILGSEYINANYIRGPSGYPKAYIACQGPLQCTLNDFWRMIWECNCSVIIMACNEHESGKPKCELYWPEQMETSQRYGNIQVTLVKVRQICSDFLIRKFSVKLLQPKRPGPPTTNTPSTATTTVPPTTMTTKTTSSITITNDSIPTIAIVPQQIVLNTMTQDKQTVINSTHFLSNNNQIDMPNEQVTINNNTYSQANHHNNQQQQQHRPATQQQSWQHINGNSNSNENNINNNDNSSNSNFNDTEYSVLMERTICQFHYTTWPDHGAPDSVQPILELVRLVREVQPAEDRPILVHCSAGCGRTGTICCIDYVWGLLRRGKLEPSFDLCNIISEMRQQRMAMVQTLEQYILCHRAVAALFLNQLKLIDDHHYENLELAEDDRYGTNGMRSFMLEEENPEEDELGPVFI